jgi:hypothetical protein
MVSFDTRIENSDLYAAAVIPRGPRLRCSDQRYAVVEVRVHQHVFPNAHDATIGCQSIEPNKVDIEQRDRRSFEALEPGEVFIVSKVGVDARSTDRLVVLSELDQGANAAVLNCGGAKSGDGRRFGVDRSCCQARRNSTQ